MLAPGGQLFFHTFNRTWLAKLIVIRGVEWFVANTPRDLHVLHMFITPAELAAMCGAQEPATLVGATTARAARFRWPLWRMLVTGRGRRRLRIHVHALDAARLHRHRAQDGAAAELIGRLDAQLVRISDD